MHLSKTVKFIKMHNKNTVEQSKGHLMAWEFVLDIILSYYVV